MNIRKITPKHLLISIFIINIIIMIFNTVFSNENIFDIFTYGESSFGDFWNTVDYAYSDYDGSVPYPPLAYLFVMLFSLPIKNSIIIGTPIDEIIQSGYGQLTVLIYLGCFILLMVMSIYEVIPKDAKWLSFIILFSYPFLAAYERGNLVVFSILFLYIGLFLYENKKIPKKGMEVEN